MISNVKKVPPLAKGTRRPMRPYPKGDITIEDQYREQKKLLNAGKAFSGYSHLNLEIIAISYEHKCFAEAKSREDYIAKIRKKLNEWKYAPVDEEDTHGLGRLQPPPQPPGQQKGQSIPPSQQLPKSARSNHQRHRSGPPLQPRNTNGSAAPASPVKTGFPRANQFPYPLRNEASEQDSKRVVQQGGQPFNASNRTGAPYQSPPLDPQRQPRAQTSSPKSQPMTHNMTNMSDTSSNASSQDKFIDIFDPKFLEGFDLNNPEVRAVWLKSVWEHFVSGAGWNGVGPQGHNDSPNNSPVPIHSTPITDFSPNSFIDGPVDIDVNMQGIHHDNDIMGTFVNFNSNRMNANPRRQSEDLGRPRITSHNDALNGHQWLTSDFNSMDMSMGGLDGVMAVDSVGTTGLSPRHFEKWMMP